MHYYNYRKGNKLIPPDYAKKLDHPYHTNLYTVKIKYVATTPTFLHVTTDNASFIQNWYEEKCFVFM